MKRTQSMFLALLAVLLSPMAANADVLLLVNVDDSANVTFTATNNESNTDSSITSNISGGFTIENFFTSMSALIAADTSIGGDLRATQGSGVYDLIGTFDFSANTGAFEAGDDISIYSSASDTQVFATGMQAFSGAAVMDLFALSALLPTLGASGNLYTGYFELGVIPDYGELIGSWQVVTSVPEPNTLALLSLGLVGMVARRRKKA